MKKIEDLLSDLELKYEKKFRSSKECFNDGKELFPNGVSHLGRFLSPFPPFIKSAHGPKIRTIENEELDDFWQGHFCNILGHNPTIIREAIKKAFDNELGLQLGIYTKLETELACLLKKITDLDQFIFTTSGTLATMYSIMMGLAYAKRTKVLKVAGGWHGAQPWSLKGVKFPNGLDKVMMESSGISPNISDETITTPFNDCEALEKCFKEHGNEIGVFILELVLGNSGMVVAEKRFVKMARELCTQYGVILIIDEMVTGFRVRPGGMYKIYEIEPDLVTFGKAITGGMPFACIAGNKTILDHASGRHMTRVWADSGTFTSHPATLIAVKAMVSYLYNNSEKIYPKIIDNMNYLRSELGKVFEKNNIIVDITGESKDEDIPNFPIATIRFIKDRNNYNHTNALTHWDPNKVDIVLRDKISKIFLMLNGIYTWQGLGVVTFSHSRKEFDKLISSYVLFASELSKIDRSES